MASLASLVVDLQLDSAKLKSGLDDATTMFSKFGKKIAEVAEGAVAFEAIKTAMEGVAKAGEYMEQGLKDATSLGNGPARELLETFEKVGLATRQLGADLMSDLAPAFNSLIEYFTGGVDWGKLLANIAGVIADAFRALVLPIVLVAGAIKGLADGGTLEAALNGAATAASKLAEHGKSFAGSLKTAKETADAIAGLQNSAANKKIFRQMSEVEDQFTSLTGNRRNDRDAGAKSKFSDFDDALTKWEYRMQQAAAETQLAANAEANGSKILAEKHRILADEFTEQAGVAMRGAEAWTRAKEKLIVDTQAINNIHFGLAESVKNIGLSASIKTQQYDNTYKPTTGFDNFGDALAKQTKALENQAGLMAAASIIEQQFGAAAQGTVLALKTQADQEGRNAEAAKQAADAFFAVKDRLRDQLLGALQLAGESFLSKIGQLGTTINDAIKGFQQGGIWGALAALVMDLLSMMDGWKDIQAIAQGALMKALKDMSSGLNSVISALEPLMGAIESIAVAVHEVLGPILKLVGTILKGIAPILEVVGLALQALSGTLGPIIQIVGGILDPIFKLLAVTLNPLVLIFMSLKVAIDYVVLGFNIAVNDIEKWIKNNFGIDAGNNNGGVVDANSQLADDTQKLKDFVSDWVNNPFGALNDLVQNDADSLKNLGNQTDKAAAGMTKFNQQLTNLPDGFKYLKDQFDAMQPVGTGSGWAPGAGSSGGSSSSSSNAGKADGKGNTDPYGEGSGYAGKHPPVVNVYVAGSVMAEKDLIHSIKKAVRTSHFQTNGILPSPG